MRLFAGIAMGLAFAWLIESHADGERGSGIRKEGPKYQPYVAGFLLPIFLLILYVIGRLFWGRDYTNRAILSMCFTLFLHIGVYDSILLLLLPYLRRRINARACAVLWMIPNYMYLIMQNTMSLPAPLFYIDIPGKLAWYLLGIWFVGFVIVLILKIGAHFWFRKQLLNRAEPAELAMRQQWKLALADARFRNQDIPLMASAHITTPVAVGLLLDTTVVVLPKKDYTSEELELIFLHEIVHIGRQDPWNKFFLVFCTAMCWFNPLMWIAMEKSAEDLELSCDETVLLDADDEVRKQYAGLLLSTAGDARGFTTCLSASAEALRYRLKNIVKPLDRSTGAVVVGAAFLLLSLTYGVVAIGYDGVSGSEVLYQSDNHTRYTMTVLSSELPLSEAELELADGDGILEYLSGLTMYRIAGQYSFNGIDHGALLEISAPHTPDCWIYVRNQTIEVYYFNQPNLEPIFYHIPQGIDWGYLNRLIDGTSK